MLRNQIINVLKNTPDSCALKKMKFDACDNYNSVNDRCELPKYHEINGQPVYQKCVYKTQ